MVSQCQTKNDICRTRICAEMDERIDRQTDRVIPIYPPELRSKGKGRGDNASSIYDYNMARPLHKNPYLGGFEICNFNRCIYFLAHNHYIFLLSDYTIWPRNTTRTHAPLDMKFKSLVDSFLVIITIHLVCLV